METKWSKNHSYIYSFGDILYFRHLNSNKDCLINVHLLYNGNMTSGNIFLNLIGDVRTLNKEIFIRVLKKSRTVMQTVY